MICFCKTDSTWLIVCCLWQQFRLLSLKLKWTVSTWRKVKFKNIMRYICTCTRPITAWLTWRVRWRGVRRLRLIDIWTCRSGFLCLVRDSGIRPRLADRRSMLSGPRTGTRSLECIRTCSHRARNRGPILERTRKKIVLKLIQKKT